MNPSPRRRHDAAISGPVAGVSPSPAQLEIIAMSRLLAATAAFAMLASPAIAHPKQAGHHPHQQAGHGHGHKGGGKHKH